MGVAETVAIALVLFAQAGNGEPIPNGWLALGGALGLTTFTIWAFRKVSRWTVSDLETALTRKDEENAALRLDLIEERATADRLRAESDAVVDEKRALRIANITLAADLAAAQAEIQMLRRSTPNADGGRTIRDADERP